jgi:hypothetical protein
MTTRPAGKGSVRRLGVEKAEMKTGARGEIEQGPTVLSQKTEFKINLEKAEFSVIFIFTYLLYFRVQFFFNLGRTA